MILEQVARLALQDLAEPQQDHKDLPGCLVTRAILGTRGQQEPPETPDLLVLKVMLVLQAPPEIRETKALVVLPDLQETQGLRVYKVLLET